MCDLCGGTFKSTYTHVRRGFPCLRCNATFEVAEKFIAHSLVHTQLQPFRCHECDQSFTRRDRLRRHRELRHMTTLRSSSSEDCDEHISTGTTVNSGVAPKLQQQCAQADTQATVQSPRGDLLQVVVPSSWMDALPVLDPLDLALVNIGLTRALNGTVSY